MRSNCPHVKVRKSERLCFVSDVLPRKDVCSGKRDVKLTHVREVEVNNGTCGNRVVRLSLK